MFLKPLELLKATLVDDFVSLRSNERKTYKTIETVLKQQRRYLV